MTIPNEVAALEALLAQPEPGALEDKVAYAVALQRATLRVQMLTLTPPMWFVPEGWAPPPQDLEPGSIVRVPMCGTARPRPDELVGHLRFDPTVRPDATLAQQEAWLHEEAVGLEHEMRDALRRRASAAR